MSLTHRSHMNYDWSLAPNFGDLESLTGGSLRKPQDYPGPEQSGLISC